MPLERSAPSVARSRPAHVALAVLAMAAAPVAVACLRLFPPLDPAADAPWLPLAAAAGAGGAASVATVAMLVRWLPSATVVGLLQAAAAGVLAAGCTVAALAAAAEPSLFPDAALSVAAPAAAVLLVVAAARSRPAGFRIATAPRRAAAAAVLFVGIDATVAVAFLMTPGDGVRPWLLLAAAGLLGIAALRGPRFGLGLLAGGFVALAASRVAAIDGVLSMIALGAGTLGLTLDGRHGDVGRAKRGSPSDAADHPETPPDDNATRLARELRGTIAELLQARRTIELQRDEILRSATLDPLTGVASRRAILDRLRIEAAEARRYRHPVALALLDVDGFTAVNHEHGMDVGDEVLREVALRLRLRMRSADALGRVGPDSFLALLPHTDETGAATFADVLQQRLLARPIDTYEGELRVSASIGLAFVRPGISLTDEELLAEAEAALASARAAGGNRIAFDRMHGLARLEERRNAPKMPAREQPADGTT
jgi:diguanylate cyclase (GGDEF)-like protein